MISSTACHSVPQVRWIRNTFLVNHTAPTRAKVLEQWEKWQLLMGHLRNQAPKKGKAILQSSVAWNQAAMGVISLQTAIFSIFISVAVAFILMLTFSSSPPLTIASLPPVTSIQP